MAVSAAGFELGTDGPGVIVVGIDGSPTSMRAGAYAAGLARRQGSRIVAVYVTTTSVAAGFSSSIGVAMAQAMDEIAHELGQQVKEAGAYHQISAEYRTTHGDPARELAQIADELKADAVVVGASTRAGHLVVGSVAVRLVRTGRWPVTVVP